jgi:hypothetical protein
MDSEVTAPSVPTRRNSKTIVGILRRECSMGQGEYYVRGDWMHLPVEEEGPRKGQRIIPNEPVTVSLDEATAKANLHKFANREEIVAFFKFTTPGRTHESAFETMQRRNQEKRDASRGAGNADLATAIGAAVAAAIAPLVHRVEALEGKKTKKAAEKPGRIQRSA